MDKPTDYSEELEQWGKALVSSVADSSARGDRLEAVVGGREPVLEESPRSVFLLPFQTGSLLVLALSKNEAVVLGKVDDGAFRGILSPVQSSKKPFKLCEAKTGSVTLSGDQWSALTREVKSLADDKVFWKVFGKSGVFLLRIRFPKSGNITALSETTFDHVSLPDNFQSQLKKACTNQRPIVLYKLDEKEETMFQSEAPRHRGKPRGALEGSITSVMGHSLTHALSLKKREHALKRMKPDEDGEVGQSFLSSH